MFHPFHSPRNLTSEQWKARARAIQARLEGLSIDELMRGGRAAPSLSSIGGPGRNGYDPNQPRVPAGHSDGGQWTDDHRWKDGERRTDHPLAGLRFAARELPPIGPFGGRVLLVLRRALQILEKLRSDNLLYDLFGHPRAPFQCSKWTASASSDQILDCLCIRHVIEEKPITYETS